MPLYLLRTAPLTDHMAENAFKLPAASERPAGAPASGPADHAGPLGHGQRLTAAFEALEAFPALAASRDRLLRVVTDDAPSVGDVVAAVESDIALTIATLRLANERRGTRRSQIESVVQAVEILTPVRVRDLAQRARTFDFFERSGIWDLVPEHFRLHSVTTQRIAEAISARIAYEERDRLQVTSLLHDVGKLVLIHAYPGYPGRVLGGARTPEERVQAERRELGVDHGVVGGVIARRWGLPKEVAAAIERHHGDEGLEPSIIRLADMLAHYGRGVAVSSAEMPRVAARIGLDRDGLREIMYELPHPIGSRRRVVEPCPLSTRELEVLRCLARGLVYKQIAQELHLSTSTVRTHLHNTYGKLGAVDRAQAVLTASERGWL